MAKAAAAVPKKTSIEIQPIKTAQMMVAIIGTSPLIFNRVNAKAQRELLLPFGKRRTKADRAGRLKHNPIEEYRDSVYKYRTTEASRLCFPAPGPKAAEAVEVSLVRICFVELRPVGAVKNGKGRQPAPFFMFPGKPPIGSTEPFVLRSYRLCHSV